MTPQTQPDPAKEISPVAFDVLDDAFGDVRGDKALVREFSGCRWTEGPAYFAAGRYLVCSDIPNDRQLRLDETDGSVSVFRSPAGFSNGNTTDRRGRQVTCEHGNRRVIRTEPDGSITVLADSYAGRRLNSPNDVVEHSDGSIWFTDPHYGIIDNYEGNAGDPEYGGCWVFRIDPDGRVEPVIKDMVQPNGLCFGPGERHLYVSDTDHDRANMRVYPVKNGGLGRGKDFATCTAGVFDGFRLDTAGRIWTSAGDGVHVLSAKGKLIGKLPVPEKVSNLVFAGRRRNHLYVTASTSVYSYRTSATGAPFAEHVTPAQ